MKNDHVLSPLRQSIRQFNRDGINFHLDRLCKTADDGNCPSRLRVEIYLEAIKALRVTDRLPEAIRRADTAIANIPSESFDILSALKRVRALLYLDVGDGVSARNLIDDTDGLELILEGGRSLVTRNDADVQVETWLVSVEIALITRDMEGAERYFNQAVNRLAVEESELRRKRINPREKKGFEQYYHDLGQMLSLYGLTLRLAAGDTGARPGLAQLFSQVEQENSIAFAAQKLPNVPLHSRLLCLFGKWSPESNQAPAGICLPEARRWAIFGADANNSVPPFAAAAHPAPGITSASALVSIPCDDLPGDHSAPTAGQTLPLPAGGRRDLALETTAAALDRLATVFTQIEKVLPNFANYLKTGDTAADYSQRGFSGHLRDTDLYNFMQNFLVLKFTGYLQLKWNRDTYQIPVIKGLLPKIVRSGEAHIYVVLGIAVDAVFAGQTAAHTLAQAQENFVTLTRMCLNIGVDNTRPDIIGYAVPEAAVADRPPLLDVRVNDLIHITANIESELAGLHLGKSEAAAVNSSARPVIAELPPPLPESRCENSFADLNVPEFPEAIRFDSKIEKPVESFQPALYQTDDILELI